MSREPKLFNNGKTERYDMRDYMMYRHRGCEKEPKDFNTYTETGFYSWADSQVLLQCDNRPCDELGMLVVKNNESTENPIIYHRYVADTGDVFLDVCISGVWSGWVEQATKAEFEELKKEMLQDIYTTDLSEEYKGVASDYGAEILKIEGKSEQVTTNGYQLFDASKLQTKTQGGATVTNNGDGSFTVSGSGSLNDNCRLHKSISNIKASDYFKVGKLTFNADGITYPRVFFQLWEDGVENLFNIDLNGKTSGSVEITQDMLNRGNKIEFGIVGSANQPIKAGTIRPMLYQEGDGTWEPFTGGEPSPNPNYPQEINNALDEPLVSVSRNLFNASSLKEDGVINFKNEENGYKISLESNGNYKKVYCFIAENLLKALKGNSIKLKCSEDTVFSTHGAINLVVKRKNKKTEFYGINRSTFETKIIELTDDVELIKVEIIPINLGTEQENYQKLIAVGLRLYDVSNGDVEWEPYRCAETSLDLSEPLRSLTDGVCDVYENDTITRIIEFKEYDGSSDEAWKLQSINSNGIANFNIGISSSNQVAGSMCNRFIFDKSSISVATKEAYHLNDNNFFIRLKKETASTVEEFKVWLNEHPVRLLYQRPTPITEKVELPIVPTFYPYTNIYQVDDVKAKIQYGLRSKADSVEEELKEHDHDDRYSLKTHNHDEAYAAKTHNHDEVYAAKTHNHDEVYAPKTHTHDDYAAKSHNHDDYALKTHSHDGDYAPKTHNHDDSYYSKEEIDEKCPYDVGDLYITLNETIPSVKWKGTSWERVEGLVPVGYKESDADFGKLGKTGGSKEVTLSVEQMPSHNHNATVDSAGAHTHTVNGTAVSAGSHDHKLALKTKDGSGTPHTGSGINEGSWNGVLTHAWLDQAPIEHSGIHTHDVSGTAASAGAHTHTLTVNNTGGSKAHSNLQPYKVFNMWVRTA